MSRIYLITLICLYSLPLFSQQSVWDAWDAGLVRELHTGTEKPYLTEEEKKVILFMNLARHDGALFSVTFLESYIEAGEMEMSSYVKSLMRDLKKVSRLKPLIPEEDLTSVAQGHATTSGKSGHVGHKDFDRRFKPLMGNPYQKVGENCSYGYEKAIDIVITLLVDEDVKNLGHRKNILNEGFNSVGVAIRPHKNYRTNCVTDFGRQIRSDLNEVPY